MSGGTGALVVYGYRPQGLRAAGDAYWRLAQRESVVLTPRGLGVQIP